MATAPNSGAARAVVVSPSPAAAQLDEDWKQLEQPHDAIIDIGVDSEEYEEPVWPSLTHIERNFQSSLTLEASLESLDHFKRTQAGRLPQLMREHDQIHSPTRVRSNTLPEPYHDPVSHLPPQKLVETILYIVEDDELSQSSHAGSIPERDLMVKLPILPAGRRLSFDFLSTWGDPHYLGLMGIELYDDSGDQIQVSPHQVKADPSDINVLPEYTADPRVAANLFDGVSCTCDDMHAWLVPYTPGGHHILEVDFGRIVTISMMRIFNLNKSRVHSFRGAKDTVIRLDDVVIFDHILNRAPGSVESAAECATLLLFIDPMTDEGIEILTKIGRSDPYIPQWSDETEEDEEPDLEKGLDIEEEDMEEEEEEYTEAEDLETGLTDINDEAWIKGRYIRLTLCGSWGNRNWMGLTGLTVLNNIHLPIPVFAKDLDADPMDIRHIPGAEHDPRTLDKLVDGVNQTTNAHHMWLVTNDDTAWILIDLGKQRQIAGLRVWNYNQNVEAGAERGVRALHIEVDGVPVTHPNGVVLRRAPCTADHDYSQLLLFHSKVKLGTPNESVMSFVDSSRRGGRGALDLVQSDYIVPLLPLCMTVTLVLHGSHGDPDHVGLNGIELCDIRGESIRLTASQLHASPSSSDRMMSNLVDGVGHTWNEQHMWLSPLRKSTQTTVTISFAKPHVIAILRLWNYSKAPSTGVKNFAVLMDGMMCFNGVLKPAPSDRDAPDFVQSVLFSADTVLIHREKEHLCVYDDVALSIV